MYKIKHVYGVFNVAETVNMNPLLNNIFFRQCKQKSCWVNRRNYMGVFVTRIRVNIPLIVNINIKV